MPSGRAASQIVVTETYRQRHEQLMRFIDESLRDEGEIHPAAELSTATTRLTRAQFTEIAADINRIITAAVENHRDQEGDDVRPYLIRLDMFPIDATSSSPAEGGR